MSPTPIPAVTVIQVRAGSLPNIAREDLGCATTIKITDWTRVYYATPDDPSPRVNNTWNAVNLSSYRPIPDKLTGWIAVADAGEKSIEDTYGIGSGAFADRIHRLMLDVPGDWYTVLRIIHPSWAPGDTEDILVALPDDSLVEIQTIPTKQVVSA